MCSSSSSSSSWRSAAATHLASLCGSCHADQKFVLAVIVLFKVVIAAEFNACVRVSLLRPLSFLHLVLSLFLFPSLPFSSSPSSSSRCPPPLFVPCCAPFKVVIAANLPFSIHLLRFLLPSLFPLSIFPRTPFSPVICESSSRFKKKKCANHRVLSFVRIFFFVAIFVCFAVLPSRANPTR